MGSRWRVSVRRAVLVGSASMLVSLAFATSPASAHAGRPSSINAVVSGMSVQVSGTWTWKSAAGDPLPSYVGYAMSWGDVASGNDVGTYHVGDGTSATNVVLQPTTPAQGTSGSWGPTSHTYAAPGTYTVCSIIYDLGEIKPFPASGQESLVAGGPNRNPDNSVDDGYTPGTACATVVITAAGSSATPTATSVATATAPATPGASASEVPSQGVAGATSMPTAGHTPPPTSTDSTTGRGSEIPIVLVVLGLWAVLGAAGVKAYAVQRSRR